VSAKAAAKKPASGSRAGWVAIVLLFAVGAAGVWALLRFFPAEPADPAPADPAAAAAPATPGAAPVAAGRKIKARLFYVGAQGTRLVGVDRDVAFADTTEGQARAIAVAEVAPVSDQLSPIPAGTTVRAVYVTPAGEAYVDLSRQVTDAHPGGSTNELLTVYALVNALTANLPAVRSVQILVDGHEVGTLAGHVDLRRPLAQNLDWVQ
jgi:Sporulation and spore germination